MSMWIIGISSIVGIILVLMASTKVFILNRKSRKRSKLFQMKKDDTRVKIKFDPSLKTEDEDDLLEVKLAKIDEELDETGDAELYLNQLIKLARYKNDPQIHWRIGRAYSKLAVLAETSGDNNLKQFYIERGITSCRLALLKNYNISEAHAWMAILIAFKSKNQSFNQKIKSAKLFKQHLDEAIFLNPSDSLLHYMMGRFYFELCSLNWYQRKIAKSVFSDYSDYSYENALESFLMAEEIAKDYVKENRLFIAKCYLKTKENEKALEWLNKAKITVDKYASAETNQEIDHLLKQLTSGKK